MTVLKWLVVVAAGGYLGGLAVLFFAQRAFIFPIPQTVRTAPDAAGFPEAEEHLLPRRTARRSSSGTSRQSRAMRSCFIFTATAIFWPGSSAGFATLLPTGSGSSRCPIAAMPARAESQASAGCSRMRRPPMPLRLRDQRGPHCRLGLFARQRRGGGAGCGTAGRQADPGVVLHVDC